MSQSDASMQRSEEQTAAERAMGEVSDVLTVVDQALTRAQQAQRRVAKSGADRNAELALGETVEQLRQTRKRLVQDTYYSGDSLRLTTPRKTTSRWRRSAASPPSRPGRSSLR